MIIKTLYKPWVVKIIFVGTVLVALSAFFILRTVFANTISVSASKDTWVGQSTPNTNYGDANTIHVRSKNDPKNKRALIGFGLPDLPIGTVIQSAVLKLYMNDAPTASRTYDIYRLTDNWVEGNGGSNDNPENEVRWNNKPPTAVSATSSALIGIVKNTPVSWNVTTDVAAFYAGTYQNYGWVIQDHSEDDSPAQEAKFRSREENTESQRPILEIIYSAGSISGKKFEDTNGNGTNEDEPGLSGWTIMLSGPTSASTTTDENGAYSFAGLPDGDYMVCETIQNSDWAQTYPTEGPLCEGNILGHSIAISEDGAVQNIDFGNFKLGSISGRKFSDLNNNGTWNEENEPLLSNWAIYSDTNGNGLRDEDEPSALTDSDGSYTINGLAYGTYTIREELQEGWKQTSPKEEFYSIDVTNSGNEFFGNDFGNLQYAQITIEKEADPESGIFKFELRDEANNLLDEREISVDDGDDFTTFDNLSPGIYQLTEINPENWKGETEATCTVGDQSFDPANRTFTVNAGDVITCSYNNTEYSLISGRKFLDANFNSQEDRNEESLSGWTIILYKGGNGEELVEQEPRIQTSEEGGTYSFGNLLPNTYYVCEDLALQDGWIQSYPKEEGTQCPNSTRGYRIDLTAGQKIEAGYDFGNYKKTKITGYKWWDKNTNGLWDKDEQPVGGQEIILNKVNADGITTEIVQLSLTSTSPENGGFSFLVDQTGTYRIKESSRDKWQQTYPADSFFDVFVDASNKDILTDNQDRLLRFGNVYYETIFGGKFAPAGSDPTTTQSVLMFGTASLSFEGTGGINTVTIPDGTIISRTDGEVMNFLEFTGSVPTLGSLSGISETLDGALQLGIPTIGLQFSNPITLDIFVGTTLNGKTLSIVRSVSGTGDWVSDGIVEPNACVVTDGYCTFQATKASYYAATHEEPTPTPTPTPTPDSNSGGGGGGGGSGAWLFTPTPTPSAAPSASAIPEYTPIVQSGVSPSIIPTLSVAPTNQTALGEITPTPSLTPVTDENMATVSPLPSSNEPTSFFANISDALSLGGKWWMIAIWISVILTIIYWRVRRNI